MNAKDTYIEELSKEYGEETVNLFSSLHKSQEEINNPNCESILFTLVKAVSTPKISKNS